MARFCITIGLFLLEVSKGYAMRTLNRVIYPRCRHWRKSTSAYQADLLMISRDHLSDTLIVDGELAVSGTVNWGSAASPQLTNVTNDERINPV